MPHIYSLILFTLSTFLTFSQIDISGHVTPELTVCGSAETFTIKIVNQHSTPLVNPSINYELPSGIVYQPGSIININGTSTEQNISNLNHPIFTLQTIQPNDSVYFQIKLLATTNAIATQQTGTIFKNNIIYTDGNQSDTLVTSAYNILFPSVNITNISPTTQSANSGDTVSRSISIVNAGFGRTNQLSIVDLKNNTGLSLINTSIGNATINGDTIIIANNDFSTIGNGDQYFDFGESITLTETFLLSGCNSHTITSTIQAYWGCNSTVIPTSNSYAHIAITQQTPALQTESTHQMSTCIDSASNSSIKIENRGQGMATQISLEIYKSTSGTYDQTIFSRIDETTFQYQINNGALVNFIPQTTPTINTGAYACLGNNPIGKVNYTFPFQLSPGDEIMVYWQTYHCCISQCLDQGNMGWEYKVTYQDFCQNNTYSNQKTGSGPTKLNASVFTESPSDINDGQRQPFNFRISTWENNLPLGPGANYTVKCQLPDGLIWSNDPNDISWSENNTSWTASSVQYDQNTNTVLAEFPLPAPINPVKSALTIWVIGHCDNGQNAGNQTINMDIVYIADTTCNTTCEVDMICQETVNTYLHCPILNCEGLYFYDYNIERISLGMPDNDLNGKPDLQGNLNLNKVKLNRSMFGDTIQTIFKGFISSQTNQSFANLFAESIIEEGTMLTAQQAVLTIFDASTGLTFSCQDIAVSYYDNGNNRVFRYRAIKDSLISAGCSDLVNYNYENGDSVWLTVNYKVSSNFGANIKEIDIDNGFFLCHHHNPWSSNATQYYCDTRRGRHTIIGYNFINESKRNYTVKTCEQTIQQSFRLTIGDCCQNAEGGNLFPYEYRNWAKLHKIQVVIPPYYSITDAYFKQRRTKSTNQYTTETAYNLSQSNTSPVTIEYELSDLYQDNGGPITLSDDGFSGTFYLKLSPSCDVTINQFEDIIWGVQFDRTEFLGNGLTEWIYPNDNDRIRFNPTNLAISSSSPIQDGESRTVTWPITIANTTSNSDAGHAWVHFKSPNGQMAITRVVNSEGDTLSTTGDIYQIGTINRNSNATFYVTATYQACAPDYIVAYAGYECAGYPDLFTNFDCQYVTFPLKVEPKPAAMQTRISGKSVGGPCSQTVEVSVELASVKFGHLDSIRIGILNHNAFSYINGTAELSYPSNTNYQTTIDPINQNGNLTFILENHHIDILNEGLPGVKDLTKNRFKIKFNMTIDPAYAPGDFIQMTFNSRTICGTPLQTINLAYDPSVTFTQTLNTGLTDDLNDTWGIAWVDYNNDGFDDCFVSNYDINATNKMYKNNGNGTFSSVNLGELTETAYNTVSSAWADYDNDGDLDVFLSNNVGSSNRLFTNNGNGLFTYDPQADINTYGGYCHNATWVDFNNDGHIDLFVTDYMETKPNLLYQNNGDGTFTRILNSTIVLAAEKSIGSTWGDYDNDGDLDAFIPNTNGINNRFYINEGNGSFTAITQGGLVNDGGNSVGASWGDMNNDGYLDLFVANTGGEPNFLYINNTDGTFTKSSANNITTDAYHSSGSSWIDLDNDGDLDLYVTSDLNDPSVLYLNNGDGSFSKPTTPLTDVLGNSYPNAWSDYDNDGDLDLYVGNRSHEADKIFENTKGNCNTYICLNLIGTQSNKSAIGAKIRVLATINGTPTWQMKEISSQTGGGAGSQNTMQLLFGLYQTSIADSIIIEWPSGLKQTLTNIATGGCQDIVEPTGNLVCGTAFEDTNGNCLLDFGETLLQNKTIKILPGPRFFTTDANGQYRTYLENGSYTLSITPDGTWTSTCQANHNISLNGNDSCGINFPMVTNCNDPDLIVHSGTTALRRGFRNQISINYENKSATAATNIVISLSVHHEINLLSGNIIWDNSTSNDSMTTYQWYISNLAPFEKGNLSLVDSVDLYANLGKQLHIKTTISSDQPDCNILDNQATEIDAVVGSVDPNDKLVYPSIKNGIAKISHLEPLHYKIRFQNVGNYYASRVKIIDSISPYLDLNTLVFEGASHQFKYQIIGHTIVWEVNDIYLPDSTENLALSQGYVKFSIYPYANTPHHALISNTANIQFDYNDYIFTNTVHNQFIDISKLQSQDLLVNAYPNPAADRVNVQLLSADRAIAVPLRTIQILDATGQQVLREDIDQLSQYQLDVSSLSNGLYYLTVKDISNRRLTTKLIINR